jgi:hypothetical protein
MRSRVCRSSGAEARERRSHVECTCPKLVVTRATIARVDKIRLEEVFKISGVPTYTFVEPSEYARLKVSLRTEGRGLIVEGPSGIGKSTAVTRALEAIEVREDVLPLSARDPRDIGYIEILPTTSDFGVVIIDDFHVLDHAIRRDIADLLKRLADTESRRSKLIIIGINRAGDSLIEHAPDLAIASRTSQSWSISTPRPRFFPSRIHSWCSTSGISTGPIS